MIRFLLNFSFDGKNYFGYQAQNDKKTVQGELQLALQTALGHEVNLTASGRTDAGVSAISQYVSFTTDKTFDKRLFVKRLNYLLPNDIQVKSILEVKQDFNPRYNVIKKTYCYNFYLSETIIPYYERTATRFSEKVDINVFENQLQQFLGTHNFTSFCAPSTTAKEKVRTIDFVSLKKNGDIYSVYFTGKSFLYNMIRIMVGTLVDISVGKINDNVSEIILKQNRTSAGVTAAANGLVLVDVVFDTNKM